MTAGSSHPGAPGSPQPSGGGGARPSPIVRLLGAGATERGPFSLLGVPYADAPNDAVMAALARRLAIVDTHPEALTPQADEVRLALHAAAAQLVDPNVRRHMAQKWGIKAGWPSSVERKAAEAAAASEPATAARAVSADRLALERDAILTLAMHGGWNKDSLRRLSMIAHSRGFSSSAVAEVLRGMGRRGNPAENGRGKSHGGVRVNGSGAVAPRPMPEPISAAAVLDERPTLRSVVETIAPDIESEKLIKRVVIFVGAAVLVLAGAIGAVGLLTANLMPGTKPAVVKPAPAPNVAPSPDTGSAELFPSADASKKGSDKSKPSKPTDKTSGAGGLDPAAINRDLVTAIEGLEVDNVAALGRFESTVSVFASEWGKLPDDQLRAAQDSVIEFIYRSGAWPEVTARAVEAVRSPVRALRPGAAELAPAQVWTAAWSLGMLSRLEAEKDLPSSARLDVQAELQVSAPGRGSAGESGFVDGAWAALNQMPRLLVPQGGAGAGAALDPNASAIATPGVPPSAPPPPQPASATARVKTIDGWREWVAALKAASGQNPERRAKSLLVALETVMVSGPDPAAVNDVGEVIGLLVSQLTWRESDESRRWLARWFSAPGVSSADLHAVTEALVSRASASGVDGTMILAENAMQGQREELRDRFARAWTMAGLEDRATVVAEWAKVCRERIEGADSAVEPVDHLSAAVVLSRLNQAAQLMWSGQTEHAQQIFEQVDDGLANTRADIRQRHPDHVGDNGDDASWGVRYIQVDRNIPERLKLLTERSQRGGSLGRVEGALIAYEAVRGSPDSVRRSAREVARRYADDPAMLNGLLDEAPTIPITSENAQLIRSVASGQPPSLADPRWREITRRLLVERLLEVLASHGEFGAIDQLTDLLAESYQARAGDGTPVVDSSGKKGTVPPGEESVRVVRLRVQAAASAAIPSGREPFTPDQIARRYASRAALADGMVQRFAADQAALCEYMAFITVSEQPSQAEAVGQIIAALAESRRRARHILEQIHASERAITEMWILRLEGGKA